MIVRLVARSHPGISVVRTICFCALLISVSLFSSKASGQTSALAGLLLDRDGEPIASATVVIPGTLFGTVSDVRGRFVIRGLRPGNYSIQFSHPDFMTRTVDVDVPAPDSLSVRLSPTIVSLAMTDLDPLSRVMGQFRIPIGRFRSSVDYPRWASGPSTLYPSRV